MASCTLFLKLELHAAASSPAKWHISFLYGNDVVVDGGRRDVLRSWKGRRRMLLYNDDGAGEVGGLWRGGEDGWTVDATCRLTIRGLQYLWLVLCCVNNNSYCTLNSMDNYNIRGEQLSNMSYSSSLEQYVRLKSTRCFQLQIDVSSSQLKVYLFNC